MRQPPLVHLWRRCRVSQISQSYSDIFSSSGARFEPSLPDRQIGMAMGPIPWLAIDRLPPGTG